MKPRVHPQSTFHKRTAAANQQFFRPGSGVRSLVSILKKRYQKRVSPEKQIEAYVSNVSSCFPGELSAIMAAALLAKKSLDTTKQVAEPFPEEIFSGERELDEASQAMLETYADSLQSLRWDMIDFNSIFSHGVAKGLTTWIVSAYAMSRPEYLPRMRESWSRLMRGESGIEEAYRMLVRRDLTDVEHVYLKYRPKVFLDSTDVVHTPKMTIG